MYVYVYAYIFLVCICIHKCIHVCMHVHKYMYMCTCIYPYACVFIMGIHSYVYIYTHTHAHTHAHTHTHQAMGELQRLALCVVGIIEGIGEALEAAAEEKMLARWLDCVWASLHDVCLNMRCFRAHMLECTHCLLTYEPELYCIIWAILIHFTVEGTRVEL